MHYLYIVTEHQIGVGDDTKSIGVDADDKKSALKKLRRYLENCYEDKITLEPHVGYVKGYLQRNAGHLVITLKETTP